MRPAYFATLLGLSTFLIGPAYAEGGPADLCQELLAFADQAAAEQAKQPSGQQQSAESPAGAPPPRSDSESGGTQGGGSVSSESSTDTSEQQSAPPNTPVAPGAASEPASSGHATGREEGGGGEATEAELGGEASLEQVRQTAEGGDRRACRDLVQRMRRGGAELPAALLALAAYEPDPSKR